jgi:Flp pilus assembly protein TadD
LSSLGYTLFRREKFEEAESVMRETHELFYRLYDKNHEFYVHVLQILLRSMTKNGRATEAEQLLRQAAEDDPSNDKRWNQLMGYIVYIQSWTEAANELSGKIEKIAKVNRDDINYDRRLAEFGIVLLRSNRLDEYAGVCHELLERKTTNDVHIRSYFAATAALLLPVDGPDFNRACQIADEMPETKTDGTDISLYANIVKSLAAFRRGRFESAKEFAERVINHKQADGPETAIAWAIKALSDARLNNVKSARHALRQIDLLAEYSFDKMFDLWRFWLIADQLSREGAELIGEPPPSILNR